MARGSRHKSHRSHKHRDRSDSEEDADSREKRPRADAEEDARVSEPEKPKSSSGKDLVGNSNGEFSGENGKKRKDRDEDSVASDRWTGGGGGGDDNVRVDKESKKERSEAIDTERSKALGADLKGKSSSRRLEGSSEGNEEKRRSEKESTRRESSSSRYKERERERGPEKDKKAHDSRNGRSEDVGSRKEGAIEEDVEVVSELEEEMHISELEKEREKRTKRRDESGDNDNLQGDGKGSYARRVSSKDDHSRNGSYKEERYKDVRCSERHRDDFDRDQRQRDDKHRDDHTSTTYASDRSDFKHSRDENRVSESHFKTKLQDSDHDGSPHVGDRGTKLKDNRGRKRSSDKIEDSADVKAQSAKESREDTERKRSRSGKVESCTDRGGEHSHRDKVDYGHSNSGPKSSPGSSAYAVKDQTRHNSRQTESSQREPLSEERCRSRTASRADNRVASAGRQRVPESRSVEKTELKDDIHVDILSSEAAGASPHDKTVRSDIRGSPNQLTEKSSTSTGDWRSERIDARRILDVGEVGQRSNSYQDGRNSSSSKDIGKDEDYPVDELNVLGNSQAGLLNSEPTSLGPSPSFLNSEPTSLVPSSYHRTGLQGSSPGHLPPPPVRLGVVSPSGLGPHGDENRIQSADHKTNSLYRSSDVSAGRGGTLRKSFRTMSPAANGFMPLQHGPPAGFHSAVQQFPAPPLFGVRPSMDLNHIGVSYHAPEANMFSGHSRPYGWHNAVDDYPPHLQLWDGSNNIFGEESNMYGRPDWNQNRHLMGDRGWERSVDMWNRQNGNVNMEYPLTRKEQEYPTQALADETWAGKSGHHSREEQAVTDITADASARIQSSDASLVKNALGTPKTSHENISKPSKMPCIQGNSEKPSYNYAHFCFSYLSKLYISPDIVQPELYEQCMSSLGTGDGIMSANAFTQEHHKNNSNSQEAKAAAKSKTYFLNSRSPSAIDVVFQRAMSLYTKQKAAVKEALNPGLHLASSNEEKVPSASDGAIVNANFPNNMEEDLPMVGATAFPMEVEKKLTAEGEGDRPEDVEKRDPLADTEEQKCDNISESDVSAAGSEDCEALMPDCTVNVSRIHHSPRSTH